jgi:hypothetical protein
VLVVVLLTFFAGSSGAGVAEYAGTLYFDGPASSRSGTSFQLLTTAGPSAPAAPTTVAGASGSGTIASGSYQYVYIATSGSAKTASAVSSPAVAVPANGSVTVTGPPLGSEVYRAKTSAGVVLGTYVLVSPPGGTTTAPFVDTGANTGAALPQADNRILPNGTTGWTDFTPGVGLALTTSTSMVYASAPTLPSTCKGWVVDGAGGLSFPSGNWTFQVRVKPGATAAGNGSAALTAAMWKIDDSGATIGSSFLIAPTDGSTITNATGTALNASVTANPGAFTLGTGEHLCVQFWRHQTLGYTSGTTSHTISLYAYDTNNQVTLHPAPNGFASASLASPADGTHTQTTPTLGATYTDAENDAGTLTIRLCSDSACATELQNSTAMAATNGSTPTWTPTGSLADNTYWWQAQAKDGPGLASSWTATRSFVIDTTPPSTTITAGPLALSNSAGGSFSFSADEGVSGYQCKLDSGAFAGCSSPYSYSGLGDGVHSFSVKASADLAGNAGSTTSYSWTIDTSPPNTSITSSPASLSNSSAPSFSFSSTEAGSSFECSLDGAGFGACPSPQTYSSVGDGPHTFQARAVDAAGNIDPTPASYSWTIDATPPDTSIGPTEPAALTNATSATFDFSSTEAGSTFECSRDGGAFTACTSPKTYSGLAGGSHTFQVRATDPAANTDPTPASYTWDVDTTPPDTTIGPTMPKANSSSTSATFDVASTEAGSTFECRLDGGAYGSCTSPVTYAALGDGTHTFSVKATDPAGNTDASPASYSWAVDTVAPSTPALAAPADNLLAKAMPQLQAGFADGSPGDSGTIEVQICSTAAAAGTACAPMVSSTTSGSVANGGTATVTPPPLPDGTYHWQARAHDLAGNQSGWSATRSFQIDSSAPSAPALLNPDDGAWIQSPALQATFTKPAFAGTGSVEFRICSDGACLATVSSGSSGTVINGATASWGPSGRLSDGLYYWQARAHDAAGNQSAWSAARMFHLDATPPAAPTHFNGVVAGDGLTLRWDPPNDTLDNFYIYIDGVSGPSLGPVTYEYKAGPFDAGDPRTFGIVAVDKAGNRSPMSELLVGVPNVVGLTFEQAQDAAKARGLVLRRDATIQSAPAGGVVTSQNPTAGSVTEKGAAVKVVLSTMSSPTALTMSASPARVTCGAGAVVRLRLQLSDAATVRARLLAGGHAITRAPLGQLQAGASNVRVKLPRRLASRTYKLVLDATAGTRTARAVVAVATGTRRACSAR